MTGLLPVAALRFREALAGRILLLLPLHFALALAVASSIPGPTPEARTEAADAAALGLAAFLGLAAAAALGGAPLADERLRARGGIVLASPAGAASRVLGTALGTGGALLLLLAGLLASAIAAVDFGTGAPPRAARAMLRAASLEGGVPDRREPGLVWLTAAAPEATARFDAPAPPGAFVEIEARPRLGGAGLPGSKRASIRFPGSLEADLVRVRTGLQGSFRVGVPEGARAVTVAREVDNLDLGLRASGVRIDAGPRPRALSRALHGAALAAGLLAAMAAALALSTVAGAGVAAAGALSLALLSIFRSTFVDAAGMLASAGAMERAIGEASGHAHASDFTGTPPALAPLFRAIGAALPDGTAFDLAHAVAGGEVPDAGDAGVAVAAGLAAAAIFLAAAVLGARRRP
ncbi:MAG TPA: hypothetical protein VFS92_00625 [Planctomycetota bacterium]|nr:hypothetical protein [Planctomycetota bacterium]